jgi:hypothetical protein
VPFSLVAGREYPALRGDFNTWFPDEEACHALLERLRWPLGFDDLWCDAALDLQAAPS